MDPSIMQFLEEDEDESMHSGADVEAMSAALNRDIGGDPAAIAMPSDTDAGALMQGSNSASKEVLEKWETSCGVGNDQHIPQKELEQQLQSSKHLSGELIHSGSVAQPQDAQANNRPELGQPSLQQKEQLKKPEQNAIQDSDKFEGLKQEFSQHSENHHQQHIAQQSNSQQITSANLANMTTQKSENQQQHIVQRSNNQQLSTSNQPNMAVSRMKAATSIPFQMLIPILQAHLDKDRSMQLQSTFAKLRNNEVNKEDFLRVVKNIVGDQMLRQAAQKVQIQLQAQASRNAQTNSNPFSLQAQTSSQQLPSSGAQQITGVQSFQAVHSVPSSQNVKGTGSPLRQPYVPPTFQVQPGTGHAAPKVSNQKSREIESRLDGKGAHSAQSHTTNMNPERDSSVVSLQTVNKQQQHTQLQQSSFSKAGSTSIYNTHAYPRPSISSSTSLRPQNLDSNARQASATQGTIATQMRPTQPMSVMNLPKYEQNSASETKRQPAIPLTSSSASQNNALMWQLSANKEQKDSAFPSMTYIKQEVFDQSSEPPNKSHFASSESTSFSSAQICQQNSALGSSSTVDKTQISGSLPGQVDQTAQIQPQNSSATPSLGATTKTPLKKPSVGQKKPFDAQGSSPPMSSKKQKTLGISLDQSIEQLNDVTAVSGVNLREEEEQLLSGLKDESRASEATRRIVQEEEERSLLLKPPLQKKLSDIMLKCGLKEIGDDVERCLSLCVEERLKGLISYLIRLSKQRVDSEKSRHGFAITSDVRYQILIMNQKAKEEWDKKRAENYEKLRKVNDTDGSTGVDADKEDGRSKAVKANKEEDDKMRTNAANVAARAAVGGDDMLSKWQLMAEQARQKREGGDGSSSSQLGKAASSKPSLSSGRGSREKRESEKKGGGRRFCRKNTPETHPRVARNITVKDVIGVLEREPQMSRSSLVYRLYENLSNNSLAE